MGIARGENRYLEFVYLELFERTRNGVISDEEMKVLEEELLENPEKGSVQRDTGGVRKVRVATRGGGMRIPAISTSRSEGSRPLIPVMSTTRSDDVLQSERSDAGSRRQSGAWSGCRSGGEAAFFRIEGPFSVRRCAPWTSRSRMASAKVLSPIASCQWSSGS